MTFTSLTDSSLGVTTAAPAHVTLLTLTPSIVTLFDSSVEPLALTCGRFSVWKIPQLAPGPPGPACPGRLLLPPPAPCDASPNAPGASCTNWKTSRPKDGSCCICCLLI